MRWEDNIKSNVQCNLCAFEMNVKTNAGDESEMVDDSAEEDMACDTAKILATMHIELRDVSV